MKNSWKRFLSLLLAISVVCGMLVPAGGAAVSAAETSATAVTETDGLIEAYPNVLDQVAHGFSDHGVWMKFWLHSADDSGSFGGFVGPQLMKSGSRLSSSIGRLVVANEAGKVYDLGSGDVTVTSYPGRLVQCYDLADFTMTMTLIFPTDRTALISTQITNKTGAELTLSLTQVGSANSGTLTSGEDMVCVDMGSEFFDIRFDRPITAVINGRAYEASLGEVTVAAGESVWVHQTMSDVFSDEERTQEQEATAGILADPNSSFAANRTRWEGYIESIDQTDLSDTLASGSNDAEGYKRAAIKTIITLTGNWRSAAGKLPYSSIQPFGNNASGFWAWDSWKHAVATSSFAPELAKEEIRNMFHFQIQSDDTNRPQDAGVIVDTINFNGIGNDRDTKPPLAAWAVYNYYEQTGDEAFIEEMYAKLVAYHEWWYTNRDIDDNGICEYGAMVHSTNNSTSRILQAVAWESGMDNATRFDIEGYGEDDIGILIYNVLDDEGTHIGYTINQESVDLNAYLYAEKCYLQAMAQMLGLEEDAAKYAQEAQQVMDYVNNNMFDAETGFYYDLQINEDGTSKKLLTNRGKGTEGWIPLWANMATPAQAAAVVENMLDEDVFYTQMPFPTAAKDNPKYTHTSYWRGPVWMDQAMFAVEALHNYGYDEAAVQAAYKLFDNAEGLLADGTIRENYNPETGAGLNAVNFGWSSVAFFKLFENTISGENETTSQTIQAIPEDDPEIEAAIAEANLQDVLDYIESGVAADYADALAIRAKYEALPEGSLSDAQVSALEEKLALAEAVYQGEKQALILDQSKNGYHLDPNRSNAMQSVSLTVDDDGVQGLKGWAELDHKGAQENFNQVIGGDAFTIEATVRLDQFLQNSYIAGKGDGCFGLRKQGSTIRFYIYDGSAFHDADVSLANVDTSKPVHIAAVYDSGTMRLYVNDQQTEKTDCGSIADTENCLSIGIGEFDGSADVLNNHTFYDFRVYSRALSYEEFSGGTVTAEDESVELWYDFRQLSYQEDAYDGVYKPSAPESVTLSAESEGLVVDARIAEGEACDQWSVKLYNALTGELVKTYTTASMPLRITDAEMFAKYYVSVCAVNQDVMGDEKTSDSVILEPEGTTDEDRAEQDLRATLSVIYNGNTDSIARNPYILNVRGLLYGSSFSLESSTDGARFGVMNDGTVLRPTEDTGDIYSEITITAARSTGTAAHRADVTVPAINVENGYVVGTGMAPFTSQTVPLSQEGTKDWYQFRDMETGTLAHKADGTGITGIRRDISATPSGAQDMCKDAPIFYTYEADDLAGAAPINHYGTATRGEGNYISFNLGYSEENQHVNVYVGSWNGLGSLQFLVNGAVVTSYTFGNTGMGVYQMGFDYKLSDPSDTAEIRMVLDSMSSFSGTNGGIFIHAITLAERPMAGAVAEITSADSNGTTVNLTADGSNDWFQLSQGPVEKGYARKANGMGFGSVQVNKVGVPGATVDTVSDALLYFEATDTDTNHAAIANRKGVSVKGVGNGVEVSVGYSEEPQTLKVYTGVWRAKILVSFVVNDQIVCYDILERSSGSVQTWCSTITYQLADPDDKAVFRMTMIDSYNTYAGALLFAGTLADAETGDTYSVDAINATVTDEAGNAVTQTQAGTLLTAAAVSGSDAAFLGWSADGLSLTDEQKTAETFTFTMPAGDVVLNAMFESKVVTARREAKEDLLAYREGINNEAYYDKQIAELDQIVTDGMAAIEAADTVEAVAAALAEARAALDNVLTAEEVDTTRHENVVHFEAVQPGCHSNGNIEYWYCPHCDGFWQDEALTQVTNSKNVILPATGSENVVHFEEVKPGCHSNGNVEYWYCAECEGFWLDEAATRVTNSKSVILAATGSDNVEHFDAVKPGCHSNGNIEYWYCADCEQFWQDEALTQLTNSKNVVVPAVGSENLQHIEAVEPTHDEDGNIEYWFCPDCEQYWQDEALTQLTNSKNVILPAEGCLAKDFSDVDLDEWYHPAIDFVLAEGMMKGDLEGTFRPTDAITRAEMAQILYNIEGAPEYETDMAFSDVEADDWFYDAVMWAASEGFVKGDTEGTYRPDDLITREEMVTIIWRYMGAEEMEDAVLTFDDADEAEKWAVEPIAWAVANGVVQGTGGNRYEPKANTERAAIAQVMLNIFG